jgi:hypothetical protein
MTEHDLAELLCARHPYEAFPERRDPVYRGR